MSMCACARREFSSFSPKKRHVHGQSRLQYISVYENFPERMLLILHNSTHVSFHEIYFYMQRSLNKMPQSISSHRTRKRKKNAKAEQKSSRAAAEKPSFVCPVSVCFLRSFSACSSLRRNDCGAHSKFNPMMILNNDENGRAGRRDGKMCTIFLIKHY